MKTCVYLWFFIYEFFLKWEIFLTKLYKKPKHTNYAQELFIENRAVCEIIGKKVVEPRRPQIPV